VQASVSGTDPLSPLRAWVSFAVTEDPIPVPGYSILGNDEGSVIPRNAVEARLGLAEYHPFWNLAGIPQTTAVGFVIAQNDEAVNNDANAGAAVKALKGPTETKVIAGAKHKLTPAQTDAAAADAAAFLASHL